MAVTGINSEDRLVQATFAEHLEKKLGWDSVYAWNDETFGPGGTLGRADTRDAVLTRDLRAALDAPQPRAAPRRHRRGAAGADRPRFQPLAGAAQSGFLPAYPRRRARQLPRRRRARLAQRPRARDRLRQPAGNNRFLAVRELKLTGLRTPNYNRRADLVCFVNGLPLVFIELKAVYKNIRAGFDGNLRDYMDENVIAHAFHHNAFLIVSNGDRARYGSITSKWEHFAEWKRHDEERQGQRRSRGAAERHARA